MEQDDNVVYIARISGNAYEMGHAYGELLGHEIQDNLQNMLKYGRNAVVDFLGEFGVPSIVSIGIYDKYLLPAAYWLLDLNWQVALPYIPQRYIDEMQGIVDGSGNHVDGDLLRRVNMIPELTQAACSIVGAWGPSTANNQLYHLRALDWASDAPIS